MLLKAPVWIVDSSARNAEKRMTPQELSVAKRPAITESIELENAVRGTLATIFTGGFFVFTAYFTWRSVRSAEGNLRIAQESLEETRKANAITQDSVRDGQWTERFTRAIEQLGSVKLEVRLGGIYALERIAQESSKDHWSIVEVLSTYVRQNAPKDGKRTDRRAALGNIQPPPGDPMQGQREIVHRGQQSDELAPPPADIQAILTVLGRRERSYENEDQSVDLRRTDLRGADLSNTHLEGARLSESLLNTADLGGAYLQGAKLWDTELIDAQFIAADLTNAHVMRANLTGAGLQAELIGANFSEANLTDAILHQDDLTRVCLYRANLTRADLSEADLTEAVLLGANLTEANLSGATLTRANLVAADFTGADLTEANLAGAVYYPTTKWPHGFDPKDHGAISIEAGASLQGANLAGFQLPEADLAGAKLTGANFEGAFLLGANLTGADLNGTKFNEARYDERTKWPQGFDPTQRGAVPL
jgi:uncharacterized protein YjbI with pentapeptide repeats